MKFRLALLICWSLLQLVAAVAPSQAEDADRFRPYFRFGNGDIASNWGVYDLWTLALGANFDLNWGAELGIDNYERKFNYQGRTLGEVSGWHLVPQVRLRKPFLHNRLVPYVLAGPGVSFLEFNDLDAKEATLGRQVDLGGSTFTVTAGGGIDCFISDSVALNLEGKYFWLQPVSGRVDGQRVDADLSTPTFTVALRVYTDENNPRNLVDGTQQPQGRGYIGLRLGGAILTDDRLTRDVRFEPDSTSFGAFNQTGGLLFGWDFNRNWGVELAWDFLEFNVDLDGRQIGEYSMKTFIPQVRYKVPLAGGRWVPYLDAGMGVSYSELNDRSAGGYGLKIDAQGYHPAGSAGAGVEYFVNRGLSLLADVGWTYSWGQEFKVEGIANGGGDSSVFLSRLGFRAYLFDW